MQNTVVITGANRGIGLSLTKIYAKAGSKVYAVCRQSSLELNVLEGVQVISDIDVTSDGDIKKLQDLLSGMSIDLLINNAGILLHDELGSIDYTALTKQFEVNAVAPLRLSESLLSNLSSGAKVVMITSRMGSIADNDSGSEYGYRMSKAALNIAAKSLAVDLKTKKISVAIVHPGFVKTELVDNLGDLSPDQSADNIALRISDMSLKNSGNFIHANGSVLPW